MSSSGATFKTSDWQWFLQDIDAQLELQMHPDQNEIERHQVQRRAMQGESPSARQPNESPANGSGKDLLGGKKRAGYGTFFDVARTGTVNGGDDDEEMPILASSKQIASPPKSKR